MKVCERVVLCKLDSLVKDYIDPLQFTYRRNRSTNDAVLFVLEYTYSHLEKAGSSSVRLLFVDFSSAFNTTTFTGSESFKHEIAIICHFVDF